MMMKHSFNVQRMNISGPSPATMTLLPWNERKFLCVCDVMCNDIISAC